jgi:hypothetical protein
VVSRHMARYLLVVALAAGAVYAQGTVLLF